MNVWGLILAAGLSSRMSGFKPLLPLGDATVLARVVRTLREGGVDQILAVTGHRGTEVGAAARALGIGTERNEAFEQGMFSSVQAGVRALPDDCDAFLVLPVDIPLVRPWTVRRLLQAAQDHPGRVLHPVFDGRRGHPPLVPASLRRDILDWNGRGGLAGLLESLPDTSPHHGLDVAVFDGGVLFDMDTDDEYELAARRVGRLEIPNQNECRALLDMAPDPHPMTRAHSRAVAHYALETARAVNSAGGNLDMALVEAAALLHDIAKGQKGHERAGGDMLRGMGLGATADIVAAHRDINPTPTGPVTEKEIVYLADKVARGTRLVSVEERFQAKIDQHADNPEAVAAIRGRLARALASRARIEAAAGAPLSTVLTQYRE